MFAVGSLSLSLSLARSLPSLSPPTLFSIHHVVSHSVSCSWCSCSRFDKCLLLQCRRGRARCQELWKAPGVEAAPRFTNFCTMLKAQTTCNGKRRAKSSVLMQFPHLDSGHKLGARAYWTLLGRIEHCLCTTERERNTRTSVVTGSL